jgi:hypothetical protein
VEPVTELPWHPSTAEHLDADLAALWRDAAQKGPVSRALMCNLVVLTRPAADATAPPSTPDALVRRVAQRHPARTILIEHHDDHASLTGPQSVSVAVLEVDGASGGTRSRPGPAARSSIRPRYGIEFIAVRAVCASRSIPSLVRRLLRGGVPTTVWCLDDLCHGPLSPVSRMGRQLIYDSARFRDVQRGFGRLQELLSQAHPPDLADLNWARLAPLRAAMIEVARLHRVPASIAPEAVRIRHRLDQGAMGALLGGWLAHQLGWTPAAAADRLTAAAGCGLISVTLEVPKPVVIRLDDDARGVTVSGAAAAPLLLGGTPRHDDELAAEQLGRLALDHVLRNVVDRAARLRTPPA